MNAKRKALQTKTRKEPLAYLLCWTSGIDGSTAMGPKDGKWDYLPKDQYVDIWTPIRLELPKPFFEDYLGNSKGFQLFSERFRDFIECHKQPKDRFQWLENPVICGKEERPYFILHFYDADNVLDESRIIWHPVDNESILKPAFSAKKIQGHSLFTYVDPPSVCNMDSIYVTKELKHAILKSGMTGATFEATCITNDLQGE